MPNNTENYILPSTLENIDSALYSWVNETLNVFTTSNNGWNKVPVIWSNSERAFMVKNHKDRRDDEGTLVYPLITVERTSTEKNLSKKGPFGVNLFRAPDVKGGVIAISRQIQAEKTGQENNAKSLRENGKINFVTKKKVNNAVYETLYTPYPTYLDMTYEITLRSEYLQQMNDMVVPFMTRNGGFNFIVLRKNGHKYEAFIQSNFNLESNASNLNAEERIFTTKIQIKVLGYLLGEDKNELQPKVVVRESATKILFARERSILGDINQNSNMPPAPVFDLNQTPPTIQDNKFIVNGLDDNSVTNQSADTNNISNQNLDNAFNRPTCIKTGTSPVK